MTITHAQLDQYVRRTGTYRTTEEGFEIQVEVVNARAAGAYVELLIGPVKGGGATWVPARRVTFEELTDHVAGAA